MTNEDILPYGPLSNRTAHLCLDMQNLFAEGGPWSTPWMTRVLPVATAIARHRPEHTIFTRFIPPDRPEHMPGVWRRYFERWRHLTRERVDPNLLELVPPLAELVPPATVIDKAVYSPFHGTELIGVLREREVDALVVSGSETDVCVVGTVLDAVDHGFRVIVAKDALCSSADETHDALMTLYRSRFSQQIEVADSAAVIAQWSG